MPYVALIFGLLAAMLPGFSLASEDADPFMFGGETNYELGNAEYLPEDENLVDYSDITATPAPDSATGLPPPPPSDSVAVPETVPDVPIVQHPGSPQEAKAEPELPKIPKDQALTDTFKQGKSDKTVGGITKILPLPEVQGTWVDKLANTNPLSLLTKDGESRDIQSTASVPAKKDSLETLVDNARRGGSGNRLSNASVFDISGIMLRMSLKQVDDVMRNRGFRKIMEKYQIPNFIKWRFEESCRLGGVVGYERTEACIADKAKKEHHQYVQLTKYSKFDTKEEVTVTFTSNFTDNKVYRISYRSMAANVTGSSPKAVYLRNIKVYDFWKKINQKYGKPDNKDNVTWGMGGNKPYLKAQTGWLLLEDPMLRELDYTRMSREDQRYMNTDLYSF